MPRPYCKSSPIQNKNLMNPFVDGWQLQCICTHIATLLSWNVKGWVPRQTPSYVLTLYLQDIWQIPLKQECIVHCESAYKCFQSIKFLLVFLLMLCKCACKDVRNQREKLRGVHIIFLYSPTTYLRTDFVSNFSCHSHSDLGNVYLLVLSKAMG